MKMKKIICLVICTLLMVTVVPAVSSSLRSSTPSPDTQPKYTAPTPAYASVPPTPKETIQAKSISYHPDFTTTKMSDVVVSMLNQVDESVFLGHEENLTGLGPRRTGTPACIASAEYIYNHFQNLSLWVRYDHWSSGGETSDNVEATMNGTDTSSDEIYIICGHYDTVSAGVGADDDTSGTVAVLMAATIMSQYLFNHTIKFVAFSGEEQGLLGSAHYAAEAAAQGWNIIGVLNCDMISYAVTVNDGNNLIVYEDTQSEWLYTYTADVNELYSEYIGLTLVHGGYTWGSDHNSFWDEGYSALFYFEYTETPYYHTSGDTIAHINATYAAKNMRLIFATLGELSEATFKSNPPANPTLTGPTVGVINKEYTFSVVTTEPDGENVYYYIDWGDGTNTGWIGSYPPGQVVTVQKTWSIPANYTVYARAKDIHEVTSGWSNPLFVSIIDDHAPNTPTIAGPTKGNVGTSYPYTFTTTDVDADQVYYSIDWGDGTIDEWLGPYNSSQTAEISHTWDTKGTYTIKAKAKDVHGIESDWGTLSVKMPTSYEPPFQLFLERLFERFPNIFPILRQLLGY